MDRGAWQAIVHRVANSRIQLSDWAHTRTRAHTNTHTWVADRQRLDDRCGEMLSWSLSIDSIHPSLFGVLGSIFSFLELPRHSWASECRAHKRRRIRWGQLQGGRPAGRCCFQGIQGQVESSHMDHTAPKPWEATLKGILGFEAHRWYLEASHISQRTSAGAPSFRLQCCL